MSYEDLEEARVKRTAKEKAIAGKGKRGRKRKNSGLEVEVEGSPPQAEACPSVPKIKIARTSEVLEPAPWRAQVARMY